MKRQIEISKILYVTVMSIVYIIALSA